MSSTEFLYFIKAEAIWTEWRGQSIWPDTVWDDPLSHSISVLCPLLWQSEQAFLAAREMVVLHLLGHRRDKCLYVRSSQRVWSSDFLSYPSSLCACWHRSKLDPPRREGMRINCFPQVQRAMPAVCFIGPPLRFHMLGEICSFSPDELAWACWSALWTEKELQCSTLWLTSQQNKHPNPEIMPSTWHHKTCKHLIYRTQRNTGLVVVEDTSRLVLHSALWMSVWHFLQEHLLLSRD